jgi:hypothetical protein
MVTHRMTLFIGFVLGEYTAQISQTGFGAAIRLFAHSSRQYLLAHGYTGAVGADIHNRHRDAAGLGLPFLPSLGRCPNPLHQALDLPATDVNAAGFGQMLFGLLVAVFISPLQTQEPGQGRSATTLQTQSGIGGVVPLPFAFVIVISPLQGEGTEHTVYLNAHSPASIWSAAFCSSQPTIRLADLNTAARTSTSNS